MSDLPGIGPHPLVPLRDKVIGMIEAAEIQAKKGLNQKLTFTQHMRIDGDNNIAVQGDVHIYIIQQQILFGLFELRDTLNEMIERRIDISNDQLNLREINKIAVERALEITGGHQQKTADILGVSRPTIHKMLKNGLVGRPAIGIKKRGKKTKG